MSKQKESPSDSAKSSGEYEIMQNKDTDFIGLLKAEIQCNLEYSSATDTVFTLNGMPGVISDYVSDLSRVYGSPKEFFAMSFLVACCAAVRKRAVLDDGKYQNFPQLWVMNVAPSGIGKTEPDKKAFKTLIESDKASYETYKQERNEWRTESTACKKQNLQEPEKPTVKQILIDDCTPEALYLALENNSGLTLHSDELNTWFSNIGRYSKSGEVGRYLSIFDNTSFPINRKADEPIFVHEPYLNIAGGIQPEVLEETLQLNQMRKNGFAQRFLFVYPDRVLKPHYLDASPNQSYMSQYNDLIKYLSNNSFGTLYLSLEARKRFIAFSNELTDRANVSNSDYLKSMYSKFEIHCLRLALILELIKSYPYGHLNRKSVSYETLAYSIELCRYFIKCGLKVERLGSATSNNTIDKSSVAKFLVNQSGLSQSEAARLVGFSQQYLNKIMKT
ncbi:MAG: DUF3987 domain-containing protein [Paludibacter sp.]|nr:DUF3987 domain-containing protein [Paludibacter sp.]